MFTNTRRDARSAEIQCMLRVSSVQQRNINASFATSMDTLESLCYQKKQASFKPKKPKAHMLQAGAVYACAKSMCSHSEDLSSSDESFYWQVRIQCTQADCKQIPTPSHLITNLAHQLKPHHERNQYLRARLDTCADVNIMPVSVYKLVFNDPGIEEACSQYLGDWYLYY